MLSTCRCVPALCRPHVHVCCPHVDVYLLYAKLEEEFGLARHAMAVYDRATKAVPPDQQMEVGISCECDSHVTVCMCICVYVRMYVCMYVRMYVHTFTYSTRQLKFPFVLFVELW